MNKKQPIYQHPNLHLETVESILMYIKKICKKYKYDFITVHFEHVPEANDIMTLNRYELHSFSRNYRNLIHGRHSMPIKKAFELATYFFCILELYKYFERGTKKHELERKSGIYE